MEDLAIFVSYHHKTNYISEKGYVPIYVGAVKCDDYIEIYRDDIFDNISSENKYFCELTAIYWAWKNCSSEYIGLNHYRRLFSDVKYTRFEDILHILRCKLLLLFNKQNPEKSNFIYSNDYNCNILKYEKLKKKLNGCSIIVPAKYYLNKSVKEFFTLGDNYVEVLEQIVETTENKKFLETFKESLKLKYLYPGNIFLISNVEFLEYCSIIFPILFKHRNVFLDDNKNYNRVAGYMGELLTNAFIQYSYKNGKKLCHFKLLFIEN